MTLATLDWGIGGLDVHRRLGGRRYLSDAGFTPYGRVPAPALAERVASLVRALAAGGCSHVVVGCNAASTVLARAPVRRAADALEGITGVIEPAVEAVRALGASRVTVLGGVRTVESNAYRAPLEAAGVEVRQRVAQPLSALVEAGRVEGPSLDAVLDALLVPIRDTRVLVLACTHYAAVTPAIAARLPALEHLIDPADATARSVGSRWTRAPAGGAPRWWTTGDPRASDRAARAAWGIDTRFERYDRGV